MVGVAVLIFGSFSSSLDWQFWGYGKYKERKKRKILLAVVLSLIVAATPWLILFGFALPELAVIGFAVFSLAGVLALYMDITPSYRVVGRRLTLEDILLTWKPLMLLKERFGKLWAALAYALVLSALNSAIFAALLAILGWPLLPTVLGFWSLLALFFFIRGYRTLTHISEEERKERT